MDFYSSTSLSFMVLHCFHCEIAVFVLPDYSSIPDNSEMYYGPVQSVVDIHAVLQTLY